MQFLSTPVIIQGRKQVKWPASLLMLGGICRFPISNEVWRCHSAIACRGALARCRPPCGGPCPANQRPSRLAATTQSTIKAPRALLSSAKTTRQNHGTPPHPPPPRDISTLFRAARRLHRRRQSVPHSRRPLTKKNVRLPLFLPPPRVATRDHLDPRGSHVSWL